MVFDNRITKLAGTFKSMQLLFLKFTKLFIYVCLHTHVCCTWHICESQRTTQFSLPPCGSQSSKSGCQAWWVSTFFYPESFHQPINCIFLRSKHQCSKWWKWHTFSSSGSHASWAWTVRLCHADDYSYF